MVVRKSTEGLNRDVRVICPRRSEFGSCSEQQIDRGCRDVVNHERQEFQCGWIGPLEVLPDHEKRLLFGFGEQPGEDRVLSSFLLFLWGKGKAG